MPRTAVLRADRLTVSFTLDKQKNGMYLSQVRVAVEPTVRDIAFASLEDYIATEELQRLAKYLEDHIQELKVNPNHDSYVFLDEALTFQIQALSGDIGESGAGSFSVTVLVSSAESDDSHTRLYLGGSTTVTAKSAKEFIANLNEITSESRTA